MTDWNAVSAFLAHVVPWPGTPQDPGWVNLHYKRMLSAEEKKKPRYKGRDSTVNGRAYKDIGNMLSYVGWLLKHPEAGTEQWFCLSQQEKSGGTNKKGQVYAERKKENSTAACAIWIDIDLEDPTKNQPPGTHYKTHQEAWDAFRQFQKANMLPNPSAVVNSGGGFHVYWISNKVLLPHEWEPYAYGLKNLMIQRGLKCDAGLTGEISRILRVPGTLNYKYDPPRPVELLPVVPLKPYDFAKDLSMLPPLAGVIRPPKNHSITIFADGITEAQRATFNQPPPWAFPDEPHLDAGIDKFSDHLIDPSPIFKQCGFLRTARETGGKDYDNPLWNLSVLCSTFMENGNAIAHEISRGHATYTNAETQQQFELKIAAKVGWPSCATIQSNGSAACAACPLLGKIKSPLQLGAVKPKPNQGDGTAQQTSSAGEKSAGSEDDRLVVPKDDHMGRARIYRSNKRPNLYHYRDDYYNHEGGHYTIIADDTIRADLYEFLDRCDKKVPCKGKPTETEVVSFAPNKSSVSETGEALKALGHVVPTVEQPHWLDGRTGPNPADLICFPNGILDITSNQFTPSDPMLFTPHGVGFDYDPNAAEATQWLNFLDQVFDGDQDQIGALQEMFGYCLSSDVSQEKVFMLLGDKRSGKDTIRHTLQSLLSPTVICGPTLDSMGTNFGMSQLIGKQLAVVGDMRLGSKCDKDLLAEHVLKLSGRGLFTIDRKHKSHWTGPLPCKLLLISNEMPTLKDTSGALASRMITFRTKTSFYGREDRHLFENKIKPELPAILLWALDGLRRMRQRGPITEPACSIEAREELAREGSPVMSFVQECLMLDAAATVDKNVMYSAYLDFAHHNGLRASDKGWFYRSLETATASKVKAERVQNGGVRVHNVVGARISNPPPKRPAKNEPIVIYATAPAATMNTAADVGAPDESDVALDEMIKKSQTSKTA
jgi:P4 family phage/plasmid primase-like protien